jgi:hypothetical protein
MMKYDGEPGTVPRLARRSKDPPIPAVSDDPFAHGDVDDGMW